MPEQVAVAPVSSAQPQPEAVEKTLPAAVPNPVGNTVTGGLSRVPRSTSLNDLVNKKTEETAGFVPLVTESTQESEPLNVTDLIRCWDAYAETLEKEVHLKNTMLSCKPTLQEDAHFEVLVHNPIQKEELIAHSLRLLKSLRTQLNNSKIQMHIRVDEANEKKLAYTAVEKYELLNEINPLLSKLKEEFDLNLD